VAHLAAVSFGPDARGDPDRARAITVAGTERLVHALGASGLPAGLLVAGSAEVYGSPGPADLPFVESSPLRGDSPYARSKIDQERVALAAAAAGGPATVVTRSFNHTGPGQRSDFVGPALALRVLAVRDGKAGAVVAGNLDVRRDIGDVRDVARAYRMIMEGMVEGRIGQGGIALNVATGRSAAIRSILATFWELAGLAGEPVVEIDAGLVRPGEPADIRGDASALSALTGWQPEIPLETTLRDLFRSLAA
jgi:GDP-4-dehydro-6-deoxy-D-mannose reductase